MKTLIVEDDFTSRRLLQGALKGHGSVDSATNGREAVIAVRAAWDRGEPYDLVCLDIMLPAMDGHEALKEIRAIEKEAGNGSARAKVVMTTSLDSEENVVSAFRGKCDAYLLKPIDRRELLSQLRSFKLIV